LVVSQLNPVPEQFLTILVEVAIRGFVSFSCGQLVYSGANGIGGFTAGRFIAVVGVLVALVTSPKFLVRVPIPNGNVMERFGYLDRSCISFPLANCDIPGYKSVHDRSVF